MRQKEVVVAGAGFAGFALATELADAGFKVTVIEKNTYLGGRSSNTVDKKMHDPVPIGPHVFVNFYNNLPRFLHKIKAKEAIAWERQVFLDIIRTEGELLLRHSNVAPPFYILPYILQDTVATTREKLSNIELLFKLSTITDEEIERLDTQDTYSYLQGLHVAPGMSNSFWRFFVFSLLNVPLEKCSAAEFIFLLREWAKLKHRKFGFAKVGLSDLYTAQAKRYIEARGGTVLTNAKVIQLIVKSNAVEHLLISRYGKREKLRADIYALTVNPCDLAAALTPTLQKHSFFKPLSKFEGVPYISTNLWFDRKITEKKFWALASSKYPREFMNTDFYDQSNIYATRKDYSYITCNSIYSHQYNTLSDRKIIQKTIDEIKFVFPTMNAKLIHAHVHRIPYVIYAPHPGMRKHKRPHVTPLKNLYLAGDWTNRELTQCMESAVRSGYRCAEAILAAEGKPKKICQDIIV